jgi:hypothetical protein
VPSDLKYRVNSVVTNPTGDCVDYIKKLLAAVRSNGTAFSDDPLILFDRVQREAGFQVKKMKYAGLILREIHG